MVTKKGFRGNMGKGLIYLIVFLLGMICLLPLLNILALSFSSSDAAAANIVGFVPVKFTTAAYNKILEDRQFWRSFGISVVRVALQLVLNLVLIVLMAYPLSKSAREFRGRNIYMNLLVFAMLFSGGMIPSYLVVKRLGLINTVWSLVLPGAVPIFSVIMVMNFFMGVPKALEEAAILDGATPIQVLTRVYIPCSKPVIATVALFSIVGSWNDFFGGLIYMTRVANYPLKHPGQRHGGVKAELKRRQDRGVGGSAAADLSGAAEIPDYRNRHGKREGIGRLCACSFTDPAIQGSRPGDWRSAKKEAQKREVTDHGERQKSSRTGSRNPASDRIVWGRQYLGRTRAVGIP